MYPRRSCWREDLFGRRRLQKLGLKLERLEGDGQVVNPEDGAVCGDLDDSLQ